MGSLAVMVQSVIAFFRQIKELIGLGLKSAAQTEADSRPTIPEPSGRFEYTRASTIDDDEVTAFGDMLTRKLELDLADDHDEMMIGDLLSFRVELLDGREPVQTWGLARALCLRPDVIIAKVFRAPRYAHVHGLAANDVIHVPRAAMAHLYRITASGAGL